MSDSIKPAVFCEVCSRYTGPEDDDINVVHLSLEDYLELLPSAEKERVYQAFMEVLDPYIMSKQLCVHDHRIFIYGDDELERDLVQQFRAKAALTGFQALSKAAELLSWDEPLAQASGSGAPSRFH